MDKKMMTINMNQYEMNKTAPATGLSSNTLLSVILGASILLAGALSTIATSIL